MTTALILASGSRIRSKLLTGAGVVHDRLAVRIDEVSVRDALAADAVSPRDIADALAEMKARKAAGKVEGGLVLGCDQTLDFDGRVLGKPRDRADAREQLMLLRGKTHRLWSAAVIFEDAKPVWRHVAEVRLQMRLFSESYLDDYLAREWDSIQESVGGYKLEEEGARLMARVDGDYFSVLGLPLVEVLGYLVTRGAIAG